MTGSSSLCDGAADRVSEGKGKKKKKQRKTKSQCDSARSLLLRTMEQAATPLRHSRRVAVRQEDG